MYPLLANNPAEVITAMKKVMLHAQALQLRNPSIMQQVHTVPTVITWMLRIQKTIDLHAAICRGSVILMCKQRH